MANFTDHPLYASTQSNLEKTVIRDKLVRLVQYFARFMGYYTFRKGYSKDVYARWQIVAKQLSLARKIFRVGKPLANIKAFLAELHNQTSEPLLHYAALARNLGYAGYLTLDIFNWAQLTGVAKFSAATAVSLNTNANRLWLLSIVAQLVTAAYLLYKADARKRALVQEKETDAASLKRVDAEIRATSTAVVWQLLDAAIPLTGLGYLHLDDGLVGLCGVVTSYLGLRQVW